MMMFIKMLPMAIGDVVQNPLHHIAKMGIDSIIDNSLKKRLEELGFVIGTKIKKVYIAPFNEPIIINIRNYNIALSSNIVEKIEVI